MFNMIATFITTLFSALNYYAKAVEHTGHALERAANAGVVVANGFSEAQEAMAAANAAQAKERAELAHFSRQQRLEQAKKESGYNNRQVIDVDAKPKSK